MAPVATVPAVRKRAVSLQSESESGCHWCNGSESIARYSKPRMSAAFRTERWAILEAATFLTPLISLAAHNAVRLETVDPGTK